MHDEGKAGGREARNFHTRPVWCPRGVRAAVRGWGMGVHSPGQLTVQCDRCEREEDMDVTEYAGQPESWGVDDATVEENGWLLVGGEYLCPDCAEKEADGAAG